MTYRSPVADILFSLNHVAGFDEAIDEGLFGDLDAETAASVIGEAGRFATEAIAPLDRVGDLRRRALRKRRRHHAARLSRRLSRAGPRRLGGRHRHRRNTAAWACRMPSTPPAPRLWTGASMGFALCPLLERRRDRRAQRLRRATRCARPICASSSAGEWTGTMNLTEPQAGSDLNAVKTRAERAPDGTYRIFGQKIFITYGEHDMADNIVHLVLARLPDAPPGTRGLSLFLVPKFLVEPDGSLGARNDVRCASIEHKLGIHASPTCVMIYGDGERRDGLAGRRGKPRPRRDVRDDEQRAARRRHAGRGDRRRAYQQALAYARERRQGRAAPAGGGMSPIVEHPDVQRMLMTMKALVQAARGICHLTAVAIDRSHHAGARRSARSGGERAALLTPIAKAFSTDVGDEVASLGVQVHGGMGYIEETGAAQFMRDARIAAIYEGTNGVQAIDLVQRKLPLSGGAAVAARDRRDARGRRRGGGDGRRGFGATAARLGEAVDALERATAYSSATRSRADPAATRSRARRPISGCSALALGGVCLAKAGLAAQSLAAPSATLRSSAASLWRASSPKNSRPPRRAWRSAIRSGAAALDSLRSSLGGERMSESRPSRARRRRRCASRWRGRKRRTR